MVVRRRVGTIPPLRAWLFPLVVDALIVSAAWITAYWARFELAVPWSVARTALLLLPVAVALQLISAYAAGVYHRVGRYVSLVDIRSFGVAALLFAVPLLSVRLFLPVGWWTIPISVILVSSVLGFGGMLSFEPVGGLEAARRILERVELPINGPSLGGVETLVTRPVTTSHAGMTPEERQRIGLSDALIRISVGVEDVDDLKRDFENALG